MREKHRYQVMTFHTTAAAMAMEKYCANHKISGRLIPVPREISAGCGLAWRMELADYAAQQQELAELPIELEGSFEILL